MNDNFNLLKNWATQNNCYIHQNIFINEINKYNRCLKIKNIPSNPTTFLIKISKKIILSSNEENIDIKIFKDSLLLLIEFSKKKKSFYYPYLNFLPPEEHFYTYPIYKYNITEINNFKNISLEIYKELNKFLNDINIFYNNYVKKCSQLPETYKTKEWAKYCISLYKSRSFNKLGFIPFLDLIQHENNLSHNNFIKINNDCITYDSTHISKDNELVGLYSFFTPISLYINFNITNLFEQNFIPNKITIHQDNSDLFKYKMKCLEYNNFPLNNFIILYLNNGIINDTLKFLKIIMLDNKDFSVINKNNLIDLKNKKIIITLNNEINVITYLSNYIKSLERDLDINSLNTSKYPEIYKILKIYKTIINNNKNILDNYLVKLNLKI